MEARLVVYPLSGLAALLLYQGTNSGLYYLIGMGVYFWAYSEGEVSLLFVWELVRCEGMGWLICVLFLGCMSCALVVTAERSQIETDDMIVVESSWSSGGLFPA